MSLEKLKERYFDIMAMREFGMGLQRICKKYKISTPTMYKIIRKGEPLEVIKRPQRKKVIKIKNGVKSLVTIKLPKERSRNIYYCLKQRCLNPKNKNYNLYGGRGIKISEDWLKGYDYFWKDMERGYSDKLTIDRIDTNGDYCKENCRWIPAEYQQKNRRPFSEWNSKYNLVKYKDK